MTTITSILGATREITHTWPDGSFECPFCYSAVSAPADRCENPACAASKWATPANRQRFQDAQDREDKRLADEAARKRNHEIAMRHLQEDRVAADTARAEFVAKVRTAGGCLRCSNAYRGKVVRHRNGCPKAAA